MIHWILQNLLPPCLRAACHTLLRSEARQCVVVPQPRHWSVLRGDSADQPYLELQQPQKSGVQFLVPWLETAEGRQGPLYAISNSTCNLCLTFGWGSLNHQQLLALISLWSIKHTRMLQQSSDYGQKGFDDVNPYPLADRFTIWNTSPCANTRVGA